MATSTHPQGRLHELAALFLRLGLVAFGGPAAHIAMLEEEVVERRGWMSREHFLDLLGATHLIPGPNSTEMVLHVGYTRAGLRGLCVAGAAFILPAVLSTGLLAWAYVTFGTRPAAAPFLAGIKPAVLAVIATAVWRLGKKAITGPVLAVLALVVVAAVLLGVDEVVALLAGGAVGMLALRSGHRGGGEGRAGQGGGQGAAALAPLGLLFGRTKLATAATAVAAGVSLTVLGLFFLKVGATLYGSGYVLVAFLEGGLVENYGWLTRDQLLDAIAIGQFTPGPVLSTATFVGYLIRGLPGAVVATVAIFLPSFLFVLLVNPLVPRLRRSRWMRAFLDAINAAAVALMLAVALELSVVTLTSLPALLVAAVAAVAHLRFNVGPMWLVGGGAVLGWGLSLLGA